jgi:DNA-binding GntR family transcriptional regulator
MLETLNKPAPLKLRAADVAYEAIESMIINLQLKPGSPIVESELVALTGMGRTPLREALMRMSSNGLILQLPRRGLVVSDIEAAEHMTLIETRRAVERLISSSAAKRATPSQCEEILRLADKMVGAAQSNDLTAYMDADQALDDVVHQACRNPSAVAAVTPLVIKCRRFWHAFQHEGDINEAADYHMQLARAVAGGDETLAAVAADDLMDYLESFTRKVIG